MPDILIYNTALQKSDQEICYTIAFIQTQNADFSGILSQLKIHFQENIIPDHLIIIAGNYLQDALREFADDSRNDLRDVIPTRYFQENIFTKFVSIYTFDERGTLNLLKGYVNDKKIFGSLFRIGLTEIFNKGGLISAQDAHHFVFPSGKHCDKFLRTGNILIKSQDIYFIAFNLLQKYTEDYEIIYCDTSSINSLAFALVELKRRLNKDFICPHIESYGSYKGFEESEFIDRHKALFLISSSTSANIIDRLKERLVEEKRIVLIYCLDVKKYQHLIICDLKKDDLNKGGIIPFKTFPYDEKCQLCERGSMPVTIQGDVFLLEKPTIKKIVLKTTDAPTNLSNFLQTYRHKSGHINFFLKCNFFESAVRSSTSSQFGYETFFDIQSVFEDLSSGGSIYEDFKNKLNRHIYQYIPSNTRYIIYLNDQGSESFAKYLLSKIQRTVKKAFSPEIIPMNKINEIDIGKEGAAIVVCSSMVSGGNLIYVSKELRKYDKLSLIYLVGFTRTNDEEYYKFIKNNLCQGHRGIDTSSFYSIEIIHCNNDYKNTSWIVEQDFIRNFMSYCEEHIAVDTKKIIDFFRERDKVLVESLKVESKGFANKVFYDNIYTATPLTINKNFAFLKFHGYDQDATQADIFFTISTVINKLRHSKDLNRCLKQSEYVRNLLDPENFVRFNDGIIQASILRAAHPLELAYDIDKEISKKFISILFPIIMRARNNYGEALMEFLYAIAIRKLRIELECLKELITLIQERCYDQPVIMAICQYIKTLIIDKDQSIVKEFGINYVLV
jgi:hypothetical protein